MREGVHGGGAPVGDLDDEEAVAERGGEAYLPEEGTGPVCSTCRR
ncbi:MAG: hypothetical protein ACLTMP_04260 [Eggerthella lenta]